MNGVKKIAVIPGDGIGEEVIDEGIKVLNHIQKVDENVNFHIEYFPWGCEFYHDTGKMMDDNAMNILKEYDAIYLGAVGFPGVPDHISLWDLLLKIRKGFNQYINVRPIKLLNGVKDTLKNVRNDEIDMTVIRENVEGEYFGAGEWLFKGTAKETVLQTGVFTREGTERVIRYAFELAQEQGKTLTSISKGNALNYSMVFWDEVFNNIKKEYPEVKTQSYLIDAAVMYFVTDPKRFEIVVTSNLFGDIVTDLGAGIAGGMGLAAGANINPEKEYPSMFEPIHGSAPDIAGKGVANPLAAIWAASQLVEHLGYEEWAQKILDAIQSVVQIPELLTPDMGGEGATHDIGKLIIKNL